jgi:hypothetical protein
VEGEPYIASLGRSFLAGIDTLVKRTAETAYICLRVARLANQPTEVVVKGYEANKGREWGVIAEYLGAKPNCHHAICGRNNGQMKKRS